MPYPNQLSGFELGYIVGLFEGEGCIAFNYGLRKGKFQREYYTVQIHIDNTNEELLQRVCQIIGLGKVRERREQRHGYKKMYVWVLAAQKEALWFLEQCYPYLIEKKEKATLLMEFLKLRIANNPQMKANCLRQYTDYERGFYVRYRQLKSFIPVKEVCNALS